MDLQHVLAKIYEKKGDKFLLELKYLNIDFNDVDNFIKSQDIDMPWCVIKAPHDMGGWGQGYVRIIEGHPLYEIEYYDDNFNAPIVHGGITWSEWGLPNGKEKDYWYIGFDTQHAYDNIDNWNKDSVIKETINLFCDVYHIKR